MRYLIIMLGIPGSGKSTLIKNIGWEPYTLSPDAIRLMYQAPLLGVDGNLSISGELNNKVWEEFYNKLESRMSNGEFIVVDATHTKSSYYSKYSKLIKEYRYRAYVIDMHKDVTLEDALFRNSQRLTGSEKYKYVPEEVLHKMYDSYKNLKIPSKFKVLDPNIDKLKSLFQYKIHDFNKYSSVYIIGDIHGSIDVLEDIPDPESNSNNLYITVGDYVDRGTNNIEVIKLMMKWSNLPNVIQLEGNHEKHLINWAKELNIRSEEFINNTKKQLEASNISKKDIRVWYRKLSSMVIFEYDGQIFVVSHGGISTLPEEPLYISDRQYIKGVGTYSQIDEVDKSFNTIHQKMNIYQIHGHRNPNYAPTKVNDSCYNLEGKVEYGGYLRVIKLSHWRNVKIINIPNNTFRYDLVGSDISAFNNMERMFVIDLLTSKMIRIKQQKFNKNIYSFNFKKEVFFNSLWNRLTVKARGLFLNFKTGKVVARGYEKFFNIGEYDEVSIDVLKDKLKFPIEVSKKENGFLGMVGYDEETDEIVLATKSDIYSEDLDINEYPIYFKNLFYELFDDKKREYIKDYIKSTGYGLLFEVIDLENDPHTIPYENSTLILLDAVKLSFKNDYKPQVELLKIASKLKCRVKETFYVYDMEDFLWVINPNGSYMKTPIEGYVFKDSNLFMLKQKTPYYLQNRRRDND